MKFYNREIELQELHKIIDRKNSDMIYLYWRRRVWKTSLILKALENRKFLYFFVWEKSRNTLLNDFNEIIQRHFNLSYLKFTTLKDLLAFLFDRAREENFVIVFDEFQNFWNIDKSIFSDLQYFWDLNKNKTNIKLFFLGSHFTLIKKIFEANKQPLYGRATGSFLIKQFSLHTQVEILKDYNIYSRENLLYFYSIFGWVAKYIEIFLREYDMNKDFKKNIFDIIFKENSFFLNEAKDIFALEFGKSYSRYFSILEAIALWNTKKNEIVNYTGISVDSLWIYIQKLEKFYELIIRNISIESKKTTTNSNYKIKDLFLNFWFKYIFKNENYLEIWDFETLKDIVRYDMTSFLWLSFESLSKEFFIKQNIDGKLPFRFDTIWNYFDKKWTNEIDLILKNTKEKKIMFVECKLNKSKIDIQTLKSLKQKVENTWKYKNYEKYYAFMSVEKSEYDFGKENVLFYSV